MVDDAKHQTKLYQQAIVAFLGAIVTAFIITPMEVIKTQLQVQSRNNSMIALDEIQDVITKAQQQEQSAAYKYDIKRLKRVIYNINKSKGIKGFWSGLKPTLVLAIPSTVIYFLIYETIKKRLILYDFNQHSSYETIINPLIASIPTRCITSILGAPLDAMRIQMQANPASLDVIYTILKNNIQKKGVHILWTGLRPMMLRDVVFSAVYWTSYETMKVHVKILNNNGTHMHSFIAAATSGALAALITSPLDVICTYVQMDMMERLRQKKYKPLSIWHHLVELYYKQGCKGAFSGLSMRLLKTAPACAIMISFFEIGNTYFARRNV